jgi:hypothetical protein
MFARSAEVQRELWARTEQSARAGIAFKKATWTSIQRIPKTRGLRFNLLKCIT